MHALLVPKPDRSPARSSGHFTKSEFQYRRRNRHLPLSGWPASGALVSGTGPARPATGSGLSATSIARPAGPAIYATDAPKAPTDGSSATRTKHDGSDGGSPRGSARGDGPSSGVRRTSLRFDQAVDGPGRVPDASTRQRRGNSASPPWPTTCDARSISAGLPAMIAALQPAEPLFRPLPGRQSAESGRQAIAAVPHATDTADAPD